MLLHCTIKKIQDESGDYWMGICPALNLNVSGESLEIVNRDLPIAISNFLASATNEELRSLGIARITKINIDIRISESLINLLKDSEKTFTIENMQDFDDVFGNPEILNLDEKNIDKFLDIHAKKKSQESLCLS